MKAIMLSIALLCAGFATPTFAAASDWITDWVAGDQVRSRLVSAEKSVAENARQITLGWQVELAPGWKTYWRAPGDTGLPPRFDWSGSGNVAAVDVTWPTPERMTAFGFDSIVYGPEVVLPLTLTLADPGAPAEVRLSVAYMICEEICIPLEARYTLTLGKGDGAPSPHAPVISRYAAKAPVRQPELGVRPLDDGPWIETARLVPGGIEVGVRGLAPSEAIDAFVDGPDLTSFGRPTVAAPPDAGGAVLTIPAHGPRPDALEGAALAIVVVAGGRAVDWRGRPNN